MSLKNHVYLFFKGKVSLRDIWYYIQGSVRYKLYYSKYKFLIREYIREQIAFRIFAMKKECLNKGECILCGCSTTALQMCNKVCDGNCYPAMMSKRRWVKFQAGNCLEFEGWYWKIEDGKLYQGVDKHSLVHVSMLDK